MYHFQSMEAGLIGDHGERAPRPAGVVPESAQERVPTPQRCSVATTVKARTQKQRIVL